MTNIEATLHLQEQEQIISLCEEECQAILKLVDSDVVGVPTEVFNSAQGQNKTTVGIMVENGIINNMLTGAPAYMSKKFKKGDRVVAVDGTPVNPGEVIKRLVGVDIPGTLVTVKVQRGAQTIEVTLKRAGTAALADKRKMFQMFTKMKDGALQNQDTAASKLVDETIDLWTNMLEADQVHDEQIVKNVQGMQAQAHDIVVALRTHLESLHALLRGALAGEGEINSDLANMRRTINNLNTQVSTLTTEAEKWKIKCQKVEQEFDQFKHEHTRCEIVITALRKQIADTTEALTGDVGELQKKSKEAEQRATEKKNSLDSNRPIAAKTSGRVKLGSSGPGGAAKYVPDEKEVSDKKNKAAALTSVAALRAELEDLRIKHAPCDETIAKLRAQVEATKDLEDQNATIEALKLQLLRGCAELNSRSTRCGVGLKLKQADPSEQFVIRDWAEMNYGGKIWVSEVIQFGAAAKNGQIRVGDILLSVDDAPQVFLPDACNALRGAVDTPVVVTVQRPQADGVLQEIKVKLIRQANPLGNKGNIN